jgi:hypothetical protein
MASTRHQSEWVRISGNAGNFPIIQNAVDLNSRFGNHLVHASVALGFLGDKRGALAFLPPKRRGRTFRNWTASNMETPLDFLITAMASLHDHGLLGVPRIGL